jgi:putative PIN family toxin of toxin-antitoxin system
VRVVLDTCILYSALRSSSGASFRIVSALPERTFQPVVSAPLFFEYEEVLSRPDRFPHLMPRDIAQFLDFVASVCECCPISFLWRPALPDPDDDRVLEAAVAGRADAIVTYNRRDFAGSDRFGIRILSPQAFLKEMKR